MLSMRCSTRIISLRYIRKHYERITKIKPFINRFNWEGINQTEFHQKDDWKNFQKYYLTITLHAMYAKKGKMFQNITQIEKKKLFFQWFQMEKDDIMLH